MFGHAQDAMAAADVVLVASGTRRSRRRCCASPWSSLQMPPAAYWFLQGEGYLPSYGMPNILAREFVVPELIQDDATPQNLSQALLNLLADVATHNRIYRPLATMSASLHRGAARPGRARRAADAAGLTCAAASTKRGIGRWLVRSSLPR